MKQEGEDLVGHIRLRAPSDIPSTSRTEKWEF
jgi:hypothetical protein